MANGGKRRACGYARVSSNQDTQDGSFETQCAYLRARIEGDPGLELVGIYGDKGKSGRSAEGRPEVLRMLADAEAGRIDVVFCKSISRLARNTRQFLQIIRRLRARGVAIHFEREGLDTGTLQGEIVLTLLGAIAAAESESIAENLRVSRDKALAEGIVWGRPRYGYVLNQNKQWVIEAAQAGHIRQLFQMAARCTDYPTILRRMNELEAEARTGRTWSRAMVMKALGDEAYIGDYRSNKFCRVTEMDGRQRRVPNRGIVDQVYIEDHHPAIVSRELFEAVQALVKSRLLWAGHAPRTAAERSLAERAARCAEGEGQRIAAKG